MPFTLDQFARRWPRLYHLTAAMNVDAIEADRCLYPAAETFRQAQAQSQLRERRSESVVIPLSRDRQRHIRDQAPLYERKTALLGGWTFADLIQDLNERVYFWPGTEDGPNTYGRRHFARYARSEDVRVLRLDTAALFAANLKALSPQFSRCNSGSPRCNPRSSHTGKKAPRGPGTFLPAEGFEEPAGAVIEVTFRGTVGFKQELGPLGWANADRWINAEA